jgi:hypothetical protein
VEANPDTTKDLTLFPGLHAARRLSPVFDIVLEELSQ